MKIRSICTYLKLAVPSCLFQTELEPLEVCDQMVICEEVFVSTSGIGAATQAFVVTPYVVAPFNFLVTLDTICYPNVDRASKEQKLSILVEIILTLHGIITFITQGRKPSKVMASKQIIGTAYYIPPPQTIGFKVFVCMIHNVYEGVHTSLQQTTS